MLGDLGVDHLAAVGSHQAAAAPRHRYGRACGTIERAAEREASLSGFARDAGEHECSMSPRSSEETINSYSYV